MKLALVGVLYMMLDSKVSMEESCSKSSLKLVFDVASGNDCIGDVGNRAEE